MKKSDILTYLSPGGLLEKKIKGFQPRTQQIDLTGKIIETFSQNKVAFLEAGTGVGKTYSYLLPAFHLAHTHHKKVAISTYTIQLQEQLMKKDIPRLLDLLGYDLQVTLMLGMNNYLCLKRCNEQPSLSEEIAYFKETTHDGRRPGHIAKEAWEEVRVDADLCLGPKCRHFQECFFFKDREVAKNSQIVIMNHHLLVHELLSEREKPFDWIVIDEAHHFEEVVRAVQGKKINYLDLVKVSNKLYVEGKSDAGKLNQLHTIIDTTLKQHPFHSKFLFELPSLKREMVQFAKNFFESFDFVEGTILIDEKLKVHPLWHEILARGKAFLEALKQFTTFLFLLEEDIKNTKHEKLLDKSVALRHEMSAYRERLSEYYTTLHHVLFDPPDLNEVSWIAEKQRTFELICSQLDVASCLERCLFEEGRGIVFLSATLSTDNHFQFIKQRLGASKRDTIEGIYSSPFTWQKQALFLVPHDMPHPDTTEFFASAVQTILHALQATYGHALLLFTSYGALNAFYLELESALKPLRYTLLKQGEKGKQELIDLFKASKSPVLFGTNSFWEGIDIMGDMLRLVIIVKLPFKVPSEPISQAISKKLLEEKKNPFFDYFLPDAVVKFKQGFGRLIRHHEDRGVVLCLDHRMVTKNYGKRFFSILPDCPKEIVAMHEIPEKIKHFFSKKYGA